MRHPATLIDVDPHGFLEIAADLREIASTGSDAAIDCATALRLARALERVQENDIAAGQRIESTTRACAEIYAQAGELAAMAKANHGKARSLLVSSVLILSAGLAAAMFAVVA